MAFLYCAVVKRPSTVLCEHIKEDSDSVARMARSKIGEMYKEEHELKIDRDYVMFGLKIATDEGAMFVCAGRLYEAYGEKAFNLLRKIRSAFFEEFFGGKPATFSKNPNVQPMCYQSEFSKRLEKIMSTYDTGIKMGAVAEAQRKIDETAQIMHKAIMKQQNSNMQTIDLYDKSEDIKQMGNAFLKDAKKFEEQIKSNSFWWCTRNCILMFILPVVLLIVYVCASFVHCGDLTLVIGCRNTTHTTTIRGNLTLPGMFPNPGSDSDAYY